MLNQEKAHQQTTARSLTLGNQSLVLIKRSQSGRLRESNLGIRRSAGAAAALLPLAPAAAWKLGSRGRGAGASGLSVEIGHWLQHSS